MFAALAQALAGLRARGAELAWFLRKEPGLRVRISHASDELPGAAAAAFDELRARGVIAAWFPSAYEPEVFTFGGPAAIDAVHAWFDADTRAVLAWSALPERKVSASVMSLAVLNDMFQRCVGPREEVWDVWCNLQRQYRGLADAQVDAPALGTAALRRLTSSGEMELLGLYEEASGALATALDAAWRRGELLWGRRAILPPIAAFHWNRWGVPAARMAELCDAMALAWSPKRSMIGADVEVRP